MKKAFINIKSLILFLGVFSSFICFTPIINEHVIESSTRHTGMDMNKSPLGNSKMELRTKLLTDHLPEVKSTTSGQQIVNLEGSWDWEGRPMNDRNAIRNGKMDITLFQEGTLLTGNLIQTLGPYGEIPVNGHIVGWDAHLTGIIIPATPPEYSMVRLRRINIDNDFEAIFTGNIFDEGKRIEGYFVNNQGGGGGWFVMNKREEVQTEIGNSSGQQQNASDGETARQAILSMVDDFQQGLIAKDKTMLNSLFEHPSTPVIGYEENEISRLTAEKFIAHIVTLDQKIEEKLKNIIIDTHHGIATMSCDYEYIVDGVNQGHGMEIWSLINTSDGWRIVSFLWSA